MVTLDRIRLTGLLRKTLANAGVFYARRPDLRNALESGASLRSLLKQSWVDVKTVPISVRF